MGATMRFLRAALVLAALGFSGAAFAQANLPPIPMFFGPVDPGTTAANLNGLIQKINAILAPLLPNQPGAEVNFVALTSGQAGQPAIIGLQPGGDANGSIAIQPAGNGNIVLFGNSGSGQLGTGLLQIGNVSSWVPVKGLAACPAVSGGSTRPLGVGPTITGYFQMIDWLGRLHSVAACG